MLHYLAIVCLLGAAHAAPSGLINQGIAVGVGSVSNPAYGFNYAVNDPLTGDNKAQSEQRVGGVVKGSYSLSEPDGTVRVVEYSADPVTGFNAVVKRLGAAHHPQQLAAPAPAPLLAAPLLSKAIIEPIGPIGPIGSSLVGLGIGDLGLGLKGGLGIGELGLGQGGLGLGGFELGGHGLGGWGSDHGLWKH